MKSYDIQLYSPLPPAECASRLLAAIQPDGWETFLLSSTLFDPKPIRGRASESSFRLRKKHTIYYNSFQPILSATMEPQGAGTLIRGKFGMHEVIHVLVKVWLGTVVIIGVAGLALLPVFCDSPSLAFLGLIVSGMLLFGALLVGMGRLLATGDRQFISDFLGKVLHAIAINS